MIAIFSRELKSFFFSLTGYVAIMVFLIVNGLFLWVFPGETNILDLGYANIDTLFYIAPWVFLFLVPAVTMRTFSGEKDKGTYELLLIRPLSEMQIVFGKYLASVVVILLSLLPTLFYVWSVYQLGNPKGNFDYGAIWGSYIGLFFLGAIYAAIGVFASALTSNQIIAFILAMLLGFLLFAGFESVSSLFALQQDFVSSLGIRYHYKSISRGVIDSRDLLYYFSVIALFLYATRLLVQQRR